jgi:hypothetical protein
VRCEGDKDVTTDELHEEALRLIREAHGAAPLERAMALIELAREVRLAGSAPTKKGPAKRRPSDDAPPPRADYT